MPPGYISLHNDMVKEFATALHHGVCDLLQNVIYGILALGLWYDGTL